MKSAAGRAKAAAPARPGRAVAPKAPAAKTAPRAAASAEMTALRGRYEREKSALEKRLTETVREIGQLRYHETRATQLERQLKERDETIAQLQRQLAELRGRSRPAVEDESVQPSLALGAPVPRAAETAGPTDAG